MPEPPLSVQAAPTARRLDEVFAVLLPLAVLVLGQVVLALQGVLPVLDGALGDPDAYMRLNRVIHLVQTGDWFDASYPDINPPHGHVQHWTRPVDALLLLDTAPLMPWLGFELALHVAGVLFAPLCLAAQILALNWATRPVLNAESRLVAGLLLLLQPTLLAYSSLGRPDHHALLFPLAIVLLGTIIRMASGDTSRTVPRIAGLTGAFAIWTSVEALTFVVAGFAPLGILWLCGRQTDLQRLSRSAAWLASGLVIALLLERGSFDLASVEPDRLSLAHLMPAGIAALLLNVLARIEGSRGLGPWLRLLVATGVPLAAVGLTISVFPSLASGPLGTVDPIYRELRLERILEIQPLLRPDLLAAGHVGEAASRALLVLGLALIAVPVLLARIRNPRWLPVAAGLALFLPLAFHQVRWSAYAEVFVVIAYAPWVVRVARALAERFGPSIRGLTRALLLTIGLLWPAGLAQALPQTVTETASTGCPIGAIAPALDDLRDGQPGTILALADHGPELLYRTRHAVLSIPNHRLQPGFAATHDALSAVDPEAAKQTLTAHGVDWILLCPGPIERRFYGDGGKTLYDRLTGDSVPGWLRRVALPGEAGARFLLFELEAAGR